MNIGSGKAETNGTATRGNAAKKKHDVITIAGSSE